MRYSSRSLVLALVSILVPSTMGYAQSADAPTKSLPANVIDQQWVDSTAKYAAKRNEILAEVEKVNAAGPFHDDWQTLKAYSEPEWYRDAKFGIFIHWGVYSVPAFGSEWYPREMYEAGSAVNKHHVATYGPLDKFGYKDFIPKFKAEKFDPQSWARLFAESGAKYVVPVFEHHDGFQMYNSDLSDWTAVKMGPHRDVAGDLAKAIRAEGLHLGISSHRVEHNFFFEAGRLEASDVNDPAYSSLYGPAHPRNREREDDNMAVEWTYVSPAFLNDWLARTAEIVDRYHPDLIYFDWWIGSPAVRPYIAKFASYYYNESTKRGTQGVIDYKYLAMENGTGTLDVERGQLDRIRSSPWQTDTSLGNKSWGYIEGETYKSPEFVIRELADVVSKNGNLLLNIGPRADGTIPDNVQQTLRAVGAWLKLNGEAIYGTRPWKVFGEGPTQVTAGAFHDTETTAYTAEDFRFTSKGSVVYAIEMASPSTNSVVIHSFGSAGMDSSVKIVSVNLLGSGRISFEQKADGLHLSLPSGARRSFVSCYKIETAPNP